MDNKEREEKLKKLENPSVGMRRQFELIDQAALGNIEAAADLGEGYFKGLFDAPPNYRKAKKWSVYAAKRGSVKALIIMAELEKLGY